MDRPTYGWGSLEYSSGTGSVLGGRWKPSHYMLKRAFANVAVACSTSAECFVKVRRAPPLASTARCVLYTYVVQRSLLGHWCLLAMTTE